MTATLLELAHSSRPTRAHIVQVEAHHAALSHWVDAAPFRAWICQLVSDTGLPWRVIARAAGVHSITVRGLLQGRNGRPVRQLRQLDAERLLRIDHNMLGVLAGEPASCESLRILAWTLGLQGCSPAQVADFIRLDVPSVRLLMTGGAVWCSRLQHLRAEAACEAWGVDPDEMLRVRTMSTSRSA